MIFSQGSSIENTKVDSNHNLCLQKKTPIFEFGRRVKSWFGLGGGRCVGTCVWAGDIVVINSGTLDGYQFFVHTLHKRRFTPYAWRLCSSGPIKVGLVQEPGIDFTKCKDNGLQRPWNGRYVEGVLSSNAIDILPINRMHHRSLFNIRESLV